MLGRHWTLYQLSVMTMVRWKIRVDVFLPKSCGTRDTFARLTIYKRYPTNKQYNTYICQVKRINVQPNKWKYMFKQMVQVYFEWLRVICSLTLKEIKRRYHLSQLKDDVTKLNRSSETSQCLVRLEGTIIFLAGESINERNPNLIGFVAY